MKKKGFILILISCIILVAFVAYAFGPILYCRISLPEGYLEAIASQSKGLYSNRLPLIPIVVSVDRFGEGRVFYTVHYFPLGSVGYSFMDSDGFNIEKPLTGL